MWVGVQQVQSEGGAFVDMNGLQEVAAQASQLKRSESRYAGSLYLCAAVGKAYLDSADGRAALAEADAASRVLWAAACERHRESDYGGLKEYGWAKIRAMFHNNRPGPLHLWGRPENVPEEDGALSRAAELQLNTD